MDDTSARAFAQYPCSTLKVGAPYRASMSRVLAGTRPPQPGDKKMRDPPAPPTLTTGVDFANIVLSLRAGRIRAMTRLAFAELMFDAQILTESAARWIAESPKVIERAAYNIRLLQELSRPTFRLNTDIGETSDPEIDLPRLIGLGGYRN